MLCLLRAVAAASTCATRWQGTAAGRGGAAASSRLDGVGQRAAGLGCEQGLPQSRTARAHHLPQCNTVPKPLARNRQQPLKCPVAQTTPQPLLLPFLSFA
jgi:hypothetical protein